MGATYGKAQDGTHDLAFPPLGDQKKAQHPHELPKAAEGWVGNLLPPPGSQPCVEASVLGEESGRKE